MKRSSLLSIFLISICMSLASTSWAYCDSSSTDEGSEILFDNFLGEDENNIYIDSKEVFWNSKCYGESHSSENPVFVFPKSDILALHEENYDAFHEKNVNEYKLPGSCAKFELADCKVAGSNLYIDGELIDYVNDYHDSSNSDAELITYIHALKAVLPSSKELILVNREDLPPRAVPPHSWYDRTLYIKESSGIKKADIDTWFSVDTATECSNGSITLFGKTNHPVFYFNSAYIVDNNMDLTYATDFLSEKTGVKINQDGLNKNISVVGMSGENIVMLVAPNPEESTQDQLSHSDSYGFYNLKGDFSIQKRPESFEVFSKLQHDTDDIDSDEMHVSDSDQIYVISDSFDSIVNISSEEKFEIHKFGEKLGEFKPKGSASISMEGVFKDRQIPVYKYRTNKCVCAEDLVNYGFDMKWDPEKRRTDFTMTGKLKNGKNKSLKGDSIYKSDIGLFINGKYIESFNTGGYSLIDIHSLEYLTDYKVEFKLSN